MMKKNRLISTVLAASALLLTFTLCTKKDPTPTPGSDALAFKTFIDKNAPKTETFTMTATQSFTVTTSKGTTIAFPANALYDATGKLVTGSVDISVKEVQKPSEMLFADKPTLGGIDGVMLVSYGEIKVDAAQNGKALKLQDSVRLNVNMAFVPNAAQIRQMPMWKADTVATTVTSGLNSEGVKTTVTTTVPAMKGAIWDNIGLTATPNTTTNKVNFPLDKLGEWRNCDAFYADTRPKTTVLGYFATNYNKEVTTTYQGVGPSSLFFKPKGQNILIKLYSIIVAPTAGKEGFYSYENTIPIGMEGTFVAMSVIDGKFYADVKDVVIAAPASGKTFTGFSFNPVETTEADLLAKITLLNSK
jgi:tellurite resistance-related uncharacterized protein